MSNKYVALIERAAYWAEQESNYDEAADWRAMREAWGSMLLAAGTVVEQYEGLGVRLEAMSNLKSALAKASAK